MQLDGNFVLSTANGTAVATTCSGGRPRAFLVLSDTGELEIRAPGGQRIRTRAQAMCR